MLHSPLMTVHVRTCAHDQRPDFLKRGTQSSIHPKTLVLITMIAINATTQACATSPQNNEEGMDGKARMGGPLHESAVPLPPQIARDTPRNPEQA